MSSAQTETCALKIMNLDILLVKLIADILLWVSNRLSSEEKPQFPLSMRMLYHYLFREVRSPLSFGTPTASHLLAIQLKYSQDMSARRPLHIRMHYKKYYPIRGTWRYLRSVIPSYSLPNVALEIAEHHLHGSPNRTIHQHAWYTVPHARRSLNSVPAQSLSKILIVLMKWQSEVVHGCGNNWKCIPSTTEDF